MAEGPSHLQELINEIMKDNELSMHSFNTIISQFLNYTEDSYFAAFQLKSGKIYSFLILKHT